jgi:hypothetical protein
VHKRSAVLLPARYFLLNSTYPKEGVIIDVSRQGACVKLPTEKSISKGSIIILEVFDKQFNNILLEGKLYGLDKQQTLSLLASNLKNCLI